MKSTNCYGKAMQRFDIFFTKKGLKVWCSLVRQTDRTEISTDLDLVMEVLETLRSENARKGPK